MPPTQKKRTHITVIKATTRRSDDYNSNDNDVDDDHNGDVQDEGNDDGSDNSNEDRDDVEDIDVDVVVVVHDEDCDGDDDDDVDELVGVILGPGLAMLGPFWGHLGAILSFSAVCLEPS